MFEDVVSFSFFFSYRDIKKKGEEGKGECRFLEFVPPLFISRGHARN